MGFYNKVQITWTIQTYKARLVAQGFTQTLGIDYEETFAPIAEMNSIRVLLAIAADLEWELLRMDILNAFLNGELDDKIYIKIRSWSTKKKGKCVN